MSMNSEPRSPGPGSPKPYDCLLKFLLVGDSDVGKEELLSGMDNGSSESPYSASSCGELQIQDTNILWQWQAPI